MQNNNTTMQDLMKAKIEFQISAILSYITAGIDKATAVSMVKRSSCFSDKVWASIESRVEAA